MVRAKTNVRFKINSWQRRLPENIISDVTSTFTVYKNSKDYPEELRKVIAIDPGGAIRRLPLNFSVFAGLGVGKGLPDAFAIPIELGVRWNFKRFNIMLGYQYGINCNGDAGASKPFIGLGYNF